MPGNLADRCQRAFSKRDKRQLAEVIVSADNRVLGKLTADDLQCLLS